MEHWVTIISALVIIVGWPAVYLFDKHRDLINRQKEIRIKYLIEVYRLLDSVSNRSEDAPYNNLESAIADVMLFGTEKQIDIARQIVKSFVDDRKANLTPLLNDLRMELRKELRIKATDKYASLRITENHK
jgi:hypothetical protein